MAFPIGTVSSNSAKGYDQHQVTVNGKSIETEVRHTLHKSNEEFSVSQDLPRLQDDYISDSFFTSGDLTVTKYIIKLPEFEGVDNKGSQEWV